MKSAVSDINKKISVREPKLENIDENRIREIIRYLICTKNDDRPADFLSEDDLAYEIIKLIRCVLKTAKAIIKKMEDLGLGVCQSFTSYCYVKDTRTYEIIRFAIMRGYLTKEEIDNFHQRQFKYFEMMEKRQKEFLRKNGIFDV